MSTSFLKKYILVSGSGIKALEYGIILSGDNMKKKKYKLSKIVINNPPVWESNPTVQADSKTEMGVPIPDEANVEYSKEYQEENEL